MSDKLVRIKNRYDTAKNWMEENPVLAAGEIGISTNNIIKVGNGSSKWNELNNVLYPKYTTVSAGAPVLQVYLYAPLYRSGSSPILIAGAYMLTVQVLGYFPSTYTINGTIESESDIAMKFIPLTDANIQIDSAPQLTLTMDANIDDGTIGFKLDGYTNKDRGILSFNKISENYAEITKDTVIMTIERMI